MKEQRCPICLEKVKPMDRYPNYVCSVCAARAADETGRSLTFTNVSLSGGFRAVYFDTREERDSHICYIDGIKCRADEARMGGIIIIPYDGTE